MVKIFHEWTASAEVVTASAVTASAEVVLKKLILLPWFCEESQVALQTKTKKSEHLKLKDLPIRKSYAETNINAPAEECFKIKRYSSNINRKINLTEFLEINYHDSCGLFCASPEAFIQQVLQLRTKDKKPPSHHKNINDYDNEDDKLMPLTIKRKMDWCKYKPSKKKNIGVFKWNDWLYSARIELKSSKKFKVYKSSKRFKYIKQILETGEKN